ncbi:MAG: DUF3426 domain-containing protein [Betaproteobacteria bacterium]|nr:DUF3426 domain-containing protein [Betaproteobacteria bacterium]NBX96646.1 DUF3426 domain-containing protein [Betaproteobacteria bacterium]
MSLAARCPHCQTVFRITGTQLAAAQGWVRCGGCSNVFDAAAHLATTSGQPLEVPTVQAAERAGDAAPVLQAMPDIDLELPDLGALKQPTEPAPTAPTAASAASAASGTVPQGPSKPRPSALPGVLAIVGLCITLVALTAYAARGPIAYTWPQLRPWVLQFCGSVGCQLPAIRKIDAVKLQGSSLSQDDVSGHHRLRVQLHNTEDAPVLMPALDVALVDAQGEVMARRMIDPMELQPSMLQLAPGAEVAVSITLDLRALDSAAIASFSVSTFYP